MSVIPSFYSSKAIFDTITVLDRRIGVRSSTNNCSLDKPYILS